MRAEHTHVVEGRSNLPRLPNYQLIRQLDEGGMGAVFLAQRKGSAELCVIKLIRDEYHDNATVAQRFLRESHVASEVQHPSVARVVDAGRFEDRMYLAMEYIAGCDFEALMHKLMGNPVRALRRMVPPALTLTIAQDVLRGLAHLHALTDSEGKHLGIVHRDLTPRNVMLTFDGRAKIIDFGLARTDVSQWQTNPGMSIGTPRYMAPEQVLGERADGRADLYSLAVWLYEALSGTFFIPFIEDRLETMRMVVTHEPEPLSRLNPNLPEALTPVLQRAMAKLADDRPPSAEAFRQALLAAAPDYANTPPEQVGAFVAEHFSDRKQSCELEIERARHRFSDDEPPVEATNVAPAGLAAMDEPLQARPSVLSAEDLTLPTATAPSGLVAAPLPTLAPPAPPTTTGGRVAWLAAGAVVVAAGVLAAVFALGPEPTPVVLTSAAPGPAVEVAPAPAPDPLAEDPVPLRALPAPARRTEVPVRARAPTEPRKATPAAPPPAEPPKTAPAEPPAPAAAKTPAQHVAAAEAAQARGDTDGVVRHLRALKAGLSDTSWAAMAKCLDEAEVSRDRNVAPCIGRAHRILERER